MYAFCHMHVKNLLKGSDYIRKILAFLGNWTFILLYSNVLKHQAQVYVFQQQLKGHNLAYYLENMKSL